MDKEPNLTFLLGVGDSGLARHALAPRKLGIIQCMARAVPDNLLQCMNC